MQFFLQVRQRDPLPKVRGTKNQVDSKQRSRYQSSRPPYWKGRECQRGRQNLVVLASYFVHPILDNLYVLLPVEGGSQTRILSVLTIPLNRGDEG